MKNLILGLSLVLFCSSFTSINFDHDNEINSNISDSFVTTQEYDDIRCRWRTCTYQGGVLIGCTEWTYGDCTISPSGTLQPDK